MTTTSRRAAAGTAAGTDHLDPAAAGPVVAPPPLQHWLNPQAWHFTQPSWKASTSPQEGHLSL